MNVGNWALCCNATWVREVSKEEREREKVKLLTEPETDGRVIFYTHGLVFLHV